MKEERWRTTGRGPDGIVRIWTSVSYNPAVIHVLDEPGQHGRSELVVKTPETAQQRDELLGVCNTLIEEHCLFPRKTGWVCPFCQTECLSPTDFMYDEDCLVDRARAAIVRMKGVL